MNTNEILKQAANVSAEEWDKAAERAASLMEGHAFGCSEAILLSFQELLGPDVLPEILISASSAFRGGMGGAGCSCGALAGAEIIMGAIWGYKGDAYGQQNPETVGHMRALCKDLHDRFVDAAGSACCRKLTNGLEPKTPQRDKKCKNIVSLAAEITGALIASEALKHK